jgi:hypothetical protein
MRFQNPQLLYFLFAIAIPILIHLFNFRKHKIIYFSSIRFLKEIKEDNRKKSNLKNLLILLSRILAISCLALAFAKPYIPINNKNKTISNVFIYVDNSFSMDAESVNGRLLSIAKEKARSISKTYPTETNFWLINNDFLAQHNNSNNASEIASQIDAIKTSAHSKNLNQIVNRQASFKNKNVHLYIISDMQISGLQVKELTNFDINNSLFLIPIISNKNNNISIDSCWINTPIFSNDQEISVYVTITNQSENTLNNQAVFLKINSKQKSQQYINLQAKESKIISFTFMPENTAVQQGLIQINDHPISFDNNCYFTLKNTPKVAVLCINSSRNNTAITTLFNNDTSLFNFKNTTVKNIDFNSFKQKDIILINEVNEFSSGFINSLNNFTKNGGSIAIFPPKEIDLTSYNNTLKQLGIATFSELKTQSVLLENINIKHSIYKQVFEGKLDKINFPEIKKYYPIISENNSNSVALLTQENKVDFLSVFSKEKGSIYLFNSPLDIKFNNFSKHALFVPTLLNIATSSIRTESIYNTISPEDYFSSNAIKNSNALVHLKNDKIDIIPTQKTHLGKQVFYTHNQISENGIYSVEVEDKVIDAIAYNYTTTESKSQTLSINELKDWKSSINLNNIHIISGNTKSLIATINDSQKAKELWKIALIFSLLFFATEILLIKLIKS